MRAACTICCGTIAHQGMKSEMINTLSPTALIPSGGDTADHVPVLQHTLGVLRRQLDRMPTLWDVKHLELLMSKEIQAGPSALYAKVMDEAKRIQRRKRMPSVETKQLEGQSAK